MLTRPPDRPAIRAVPRAGRWGRIGQYGVVVNTPDVQDRQIERALLLGGGGQARPPRRASAVTAARAGVFLLVLCAVAAAGWLGWQAREWTFDHTGDRRLWFDIHNAWERGHWVYNDALMLAGKPPPDALGRSVGRTIGRWFAQAAEAERPGGPTTLPDDEAFTRSPRLTLAEFWRGYVGLYDKVAARARGKDRPEGARYAIDYAPGRLLIVAAWVWHVRETTPGVQDYEDRHARPLMLLNATAAAAGAAAMAGLVFLWLRHSADAAADADPSAAVLRRLSGRPEPILGPAGWAGVAGAAAGILFWLNPSSILNAHGFVQWDTWILPFIVAATAACALGRWGLGGLLFGLSLGLKGQTLMVLPMFALWPLFRGDIGAAARLAIGVGLGWLINGAPWLVPDGAAWVWVASVVGLAAVWARQDYPRTVGTAWWLSAGVTTALIVGPWANELHVAKIWIPLGLIGLMIVLPWMLSTQRWAWSIVGLSAGVALVAAADRFGGSWNWFQVSYVWPSYQYKELTMGPTSNLPAILASFGWRIDDAVWSGDLWGAPRTLTMRQALIVAYAACITVVAAGAARRQARGDPRLLIAVAAPWLLMFALLPQMHERYLVWGAAVAVAAVGCSLGYTLLAGLLIGLSLAATYHGMLNPNAHVAPNVHRVLEQLRPGIAWLTVLTAAIYLYASVAPGPRYRGAA